MHPAPYYRQSDEAVLLAQLARQPFCLIVASPKGAPMVAHAPVTTVTSGGRLYLEFHISARNPLAPLIAEGFEAVAVSLGPDAYVSPDWYGTADQVPTWDYVSVEAQGTVSPMGPDDTVAQLSALSAMMEAKLAPKPPWTLDKVSAPRFEALQRGIVGGRMLVERLEGTFKLQQNRSVDERTGVMAGLGDDPIVERMKAGL